MAEPGHKSTAGLPEGAQPDRKPLHERPAYRRHAEAFKEQVCHEIRSGQIGRREAQQRYDLSDNLIHQWLQAYDPQHPVAGAADPPDLHAACDAKIHALERKIGQLVMELERRSAEALEAPQPKERHSGRGRLE